MLLYELKILLIFALHLCDLNDCEKIYGGLYQNHRYTVLLTRDHESKYQGFR